jgi:hypothetical protein
VIEVKIDYMANRTTNTMIQAARKRPSQESSRERAARVQREFARHEISLQEWTERCTINAIWYLTDPFGAMRNANLGIEETLISDLEELHEEYGWQRQIPLQTRRTA